MARTPQPVSEINHWRLFRRVQGERVETYIAVCPACHRKHTLPVKFLKAHAVCDACHRFIRSVVHTIPTDTLNQIKDKYQEHLRICASIGSHPETLASFLRDYIEYPALLEEESIVYRDEPTHASPLTWLVHREKE